MFIADKWSDFEILYAGSEEKLERWGEYILRRPDPQAIWTINYSDVIKPDAYYVRSSTGGGAWSKPNKLPSTWKISYDSLGKKLTFIIEPTSFKHTGLFPEQASNWDFCGKLIEDETSKGRRDLKVLNLFAYTGGATIASMAHGAGETVHVDSSKGMIARAKENVVASSLEDKYVRFINEDARRFVEREIRRGRKYDGIIMDPPKYGRGPTGELWDISKSLYPFIERCKLLLSDNPLFFVISSYATDLGPSAVANAMELSLRDFGGQIAYDELGLPINNMGINLPCGQVARWTFR